MNKLNSVEATFLNGMNAHLKPEADRQAVINLLRNVTFVVFEEGKKAGRTSYQGDVTWSDDDLLKGIK